MVISNKYLIIIYKDMVVKNALEGITQTKKEHFA